MAKIFCVLYDDPVTGDGPDGVVVPQYHPITSNQKVACLGVADPAEFVNTARY